MGKNNRIAVSIPYTETSWRLDQAVEFWENQTRKPDEILTLNWNELSNKEPEFSQARCRNVDIKRTTCDYILFTDVDIRPAPDVLEKVEAELDPDRVMMCGRLDLPKESNSPAAFKDKTFEEWKKVGVPHPAPGSLQVFSVKWLKEARGFDERYWGWGYFDCEILRRGIGEKWLKADILHVWHLPSHPNSERNRELYQSPIEYRVNLGGWGEK